MNKYELRKYRVLEKKKQSLIDELAECGVKITGEVTGMPHGSGVSNPVEQLTERRMAINDRLIKTIDEIDALRSRIEDVLSTLDERDYTLMHRHYILGEQWEDVAEYMHYDVRTVFKFHGRILNNIKYL